MKKTYVTALLQLLTTNPDTTMVLKGFKETLEARGHAQLYVRVLCIVLRQLEAARPQTLLTVASEKERVRLAEEISTTLSELKAPADPIVSIDSTLIGGYIAEHKYVRVDTTFKRVLSSLYRKIAD